MTILQRASYLRQDCEITARQMQFSSFVKVETVQVRHRCFPRLTPQQNTHINIVRELVHRRPASGVLLYNHQQQRFALIEQFRVGAIDDEHSPWQLEIIAGVLDGDESPEQCIRRESVEEAGCEIQHLTHICTFYPSAGACSELFYLYAGQVDLSNIQSSVHGVAEEGEDIFLHLFDYQDIPTLLSSGRLRNAPVIIALQWLAQQATSIADS